MFTGIIEEIGTIKQMIPGKKSYKITVSAEKELNLNIGKEVFVGFKAMSVATLKL